MGGILHRPSCLVPYGESCERDNRKTRKEGSSHCQDAVLLNKESDLVALAVPELIQMPLYDSKLRMVRWGGKT